MVKAIIYLLLKNLHECTSKTKYKNTSMYHGKCLQLFYIYTALEITDVQRSLNAGIWYMTTQKTFAKIKMTAEFFLISKIKFLFNLGSILFS